MLQIINFYTTYTHILLVDLLFLHYLYSLYSLYSLYFYIFSGFVILPSVSVKPLSELVNFNCLKTPPKNVSKSKGQFKEELQHINNPKTKIANKSAPSILPPC